MRRIKTDSVLPENTQGWHYRSNQPSAPPNPLSGLASLSCGIPKTRPNCASWVKLIQTVQLWRNCLRRLRDRQIPTGEADDAWALLSAIGEEWSRRRQNGVDPVEFFRWPSTEAYPGNGGLETREWIADGMLRYLGYTVGINGLSDDERQLILEEAFRSQLPPAFPPEYLDEWGMPETSARLQKLAETIAAFTRNARRKRASRMDTAITHWERDLQYLYDQFYIGVFRFVWPATSIQSTVSPK
jgi:hypothetical protein